MVVAPAAALSPGRGKKLLFGGIGIVAVAVIILLAGKIFFRVPPDAQFSIAYANPSALCSDGKNLLVADWVMQKVYRHVKDKSFSVAKEYGTDGIEPSGLAFDGKYLWISHSFGHRIYRYKYNDTAFVMAASATSPGPSPSGLYFDGEYLWSLDFQQGKIYKHKTDGGLKVLASYDSPAANPCGMFKEGSFFYVGDSSTNRIYKINPETFSVAGIYLLPEYENQKMHMSGITWDGKSLWTCSDGIPKVFRHRMKSLKQVQFNK